MTRRPPKDCLGLAILDLRHRLSDHQGGRQAGPLTLRPAPMDHPSGVQNNATECSQRGGYSRWVETACPACPQLPDARGATPRPEHTCVCSLYLATKKILLSVDNPCGPEKVLASYETFCHQPPRFTGYFFTQFHRSRIIIQYS